MTTFLGDATSIVLTLLSSLFTRTPAPHHLLTLFLVLQGAPRPIQEGWKSSQLSQSSNNRFLCPGWLEEWNDLGTLKDNAESHMCSSWTLSFNTCSWAVEWEITLIQWKPPLHYLTSSPTGYGTQKGRDHTNIPQLHGSLGQTQWEARGRYTM